MMPAVSQPMFQPRMSLKGSVIEGEHSAHQHSHKPCHNSRLKRQFFPIILTVLTIGLILMLSLFDGSDMGIEGALTGGLLKRQTFSNTNTNSQTPFVRNKLYLIVVFVGLVIVVLLAIMLSAWCCKGAFQNPCCCPCYLCACCGGLACLECVGCGLCADGLSDVNV